jgi:uncharacterized integral membrane protein
MIKTFSIYFVAMLGILAGIFALLTAGAVAFAYIANNLSDPVVLTVAVSLSVIIPAAALALTITLMEHNDEGL